ncbi:unnamed protein product [Amoebophrya sp. A120]|nr:unnamed protein product [Amoebophrya sp. A120]|eukprot:GSA120T00015699001.1
MFQPQIILPPSWPSILPTATTQLQQQLPHVSLSDLVKTAVRQNRHAHVSRSAQLTNRVAQAAADLPHLPVAVVGNAFPGIRVGEIKSKEHEQNGIDDKGHHAGRRGTTGNYHVNKYGDFFYRRIVNDDEYADAREDNELHFDYDIRHPDYQAELDWEKEANISAPFGYECRYIFMQTMDQEALFRWKEELEAELAGRSVRREISAGREQLPDKETLLDEIIAMIVPAEELQRDKDGYYCPSPETRAAMEEEDANQRGLFR